MSQTNVLGGVAVLVILGTFLFANKMSTNNKETEIACYQVVGQASDVSEARKLSMLKACNK